MTANLNKRGHARARSCRLASTFIELIKSRCINQSRQYQHMFWLEASHPRVLLKYMYSAQEEACLLNVIDCHNLPPPIPYHL